ncbi:hypothetical protein B6U84_01685 [Candidatus Bathyarchaeota archaeon ex4484_40]|nr:MAG: hypothetical protein B6U84_01685 [Candidatus Bathyarchaeota archaeon ex4484_40]
MNIQLYSSFNLLRESDKESAKRKEGENVKLEAFLKPRSIAVIGASRNPEKVGHIIFRNLINSGYEGDLYPINPNTTELLGRKCYHA